MNAHPDNKGGAPPFTQEECQALLKEARNKPVEWRIGDDTAV